MRGRRLVGELAAGLYAAALLAVVVAPGVVLLLAGQLGGLELSLSALDLVATSGVVGLAYALVAFRRVRRQSTATRSRADVWIAAAQALVVLALMASLLLALVLHQIAPLQDTLANGEWSLLVVWGGVQLLAVVLAEVTERLAFRWLTRG